jgi:hypothetical protein
MVLVMTDVTFLSMKLSKFLVRFQFFTAVTMKNGVFWDVASCRYYVN